MFIFTTIKKFKRSWQVSFIELTFYIVKIIFFFYVLNSFFHWAPYHSCSHFVEHLLYHLKRWIFCLQVQVSVLMVHLLEYRQFFLRVLVHFFSKTAPPNHVAWLAFVFVALGKKYSVGGDSGGAEGVASREILCTGDNGSAAVIILGLLLDGGGEGGWRWQWSLWERRWRWWSKTWIKLFLLFFKASSLDFILMST